MLNDRSNYRKMANSKMSEAERFTDWVYEEVLPALRKDGQYKIEMSTKDDKIRALADGFLVANKAPIAANENLDKARQDSEQARQDGVVRSI